jgi:hypothetical protein
LVLLSWAGIIIHQLFAVPWQQVTQHLLAGYRPFCDCVVAVGDAGASSFP